MLLGAPASLSKGGLYLINCNADLMLTNEHTRYQSNYLRRKFSVQGLHIFNSKDTV